MSEQIKNNLWSLVENSNVYSFEKNPLPVFHIFASYYVDLSLDKFEHDLPQKWVKLLELLKSITEPEFEGESIGFFREFESTLSKIGNNKAQLAEIVDFFSKKYLGIISTTDYRPILSQDLENLIYWYATGYEACTTELAIYNPFAQSCSFGKEHARGLNYQLNCDLSRDMKLSQKLERRDEYKECSWYHGVENDPFLNIIGNVVLLVNNPTNLEQMFVHLGDSMTDDISNFSGGWCLMTIPPLESYHEVLKSDAAKVDSLIDKFINAEGMTTAFIILPKSFCYDYEYEDTRRKVICNGLLGGVMELPSEAFENGSDCIVLYLRRSSYECGTNLIDARPFWKEGKLDFHTLINICVNDEPSDSCLRVGDYTFSQCNYCVLPSMYLQPDQMCIEDEDLEKCFKKYNSFVEMQRKSEKNRIAHRDISGQLAHMLGGCYHVIADAISEIEHREGVSETSNVLRVSFDYMKRLINSFDDDLSKTKMNLEEVSVNDFLQSYVKGWNVYGKKQFKVHYESSLPENTTFKVDTTFMKVLLDALLENANRHGFGDSNITNPEVKISTAYTTINKLGCVRLTVANNGVPFPEDFTLEQYIREGEFGGKSGRSGRGGYHVYQIAKRHGGYLALSSDNDWNVIIDIMIPAEYYDECETEKFKQYEHKYL